MDLMILNGYDLARLFIGGANNLGLDVERINALNVFPVPDGDTGTNMKMTIDGGIKVCNNNVKNIGELAKDIARSMVLSARGNSGVILSQFFKGLAMGLEELDEVNVIEFAKAMVSGTKRSYSVVSKPTEGTILTVMREAGDEALKEVNNEMTFIEYFKCYLDAANKTLAKTPELLPVLKKAGVIDSGGAGFILIIEGFLKTLLGEEIAVNKDSKVNVIDTSNFNADSELTYGYCTEFILQLQNSKVNPHDFDLDIIIRFLESIGNSIVAFKDDDIIKVHVHTFDPGIVLTECRKYGEFLTLKIENMNVSHSETELVNEEKETEIIHKEYAVIAVANGSGLVKAFKEIGVDEVVTGGQTMNTSTEDFLKAFEKVSADYILVYPNNRNILMAAKIAAESYDKAKVIVVPTKTIMEGYSAISMLDCEGNDLETILKEEYEAIERVKTLEVTYAVRDAEINEIKINKGEYICLYDHELISVDVNREEAVKKAFRKIPDFEEKEVLTIFCGQDVNIEECHHIGKFAKTLNSFMEVYPIQGDQDIYSYIIGIE